MDFSKIFELRLFNHSLSYSGHYMYAEASDVTGEVRMAGDIARLNSPTFLPVSTDICLNFYYHMYGLSMGSLNVRVSSF